MKRKIVGVAFATVLIFAFTVHAEKPATETLKVTVSQAGADTLTCLMAPQARA